MSGSGTPSGGERPRVRGSLGGWLVILFAGSSILPLLASNVWGYLRTRDYALSSARREVRETAARGATEARSFVREVRDLLPSMISGNQHLFATTRALLLPAAATEHAVYEQALRIHLAAKAERGGGDGREFAVINAQGRLLASSAISRRRGEDWSASPCYTGRRESEVTLHGAVPGKTGPLLLASAPVRVGMAVPEAVFCARVPIGRLQARIGSHHGRIAGTRIALVSGEGRELAISGTAPGAAVPGALVARRALIRSAARESVDGRYVTAGGEVLAAYAPVGAMGWGVLVEIPVSAALADLDHLKWQAIWGSAALVCALVVVILLFARVLGGSLSSLASAARHIADGQLGERVPDQSIAELAELAGTFNTMSGALRASHDELEQRIAERTAALERSLHFTNLLLDSVDHHVIVVDRESRVVRANSAARAAYGDWLVGADFGRICEGTPVPKGGGEGMSCGDCAVGRTFASGRPDHAERALETAAGAHIVQLQTWPVEGADGVEAVVEIGRVVTDERQLQAQMMHQEKMAAFGLLAAGVAHEIGNPLAALDSQLQVARHRDEPEVMRRTLDVTAAQVARIGRLLRELVDFARRKRDAVGLVAPHAVTEDVCRLLGHDSRARGVTIINDAPVDLPPLRLQEDHLVQVLLNLGMNALDAMPEGGELRFSAEVGDGEMTLLVCDTGQGIAPDRQAQVFAPFFTTKPAGRGTGLGLFVSRNVIAGFGGTLELRHSTPGGTVFAVHIPTLSAAEAP